MATGEGKTLTATMPATVAGWRGRGCHVITVNDYLAKRDAEWMGRIYSFCGLTVAYVEQEMPPPQRRAAYLGGHHLLHQQGSHRRLPARPPGPGPAARAARRRCSTKIVERPAAGTDRLVQRGLHFAIVDEADSILIDEAVTPLIISGDAPNPEQVEAFQQAARPGRGSCERRGLTRVNHRYREVDLTDAGKRALGGTGRGPWAASGPGAAGARNWSSRP